MDQLPAAYLAHIASQIGFLSAFLGGFAATLLALLLTTSGDRRVGTWAVGFCAAAAIAVIISVIGSTMLVTVLHPEAPSRLLDQDAVNRARLVSTLGFMLALYCLLITIGLGGWLRSRRTGLITSVLAAIGLVIATWGFGGF